MCFVKAGSQNRWVIQHVGSGDERAKDRQDRQDSPLSDAMSALSSQQSLHSISLTRTPGTML